MSEELQTEIETPKSFKIKPVSKKKKRNFDIYKNSLINQQVYISIMNVNKNIKETLRNTIASNIEGKCISEGYVKPDSVQIITYSSGVIKGSDILFEVVLECKVCCPVEGMHIICVAKNITKAGIRAELNEENSPVVIFIARDHNYLSKTFSSIQENEEIKIRVIGQRYELNDKYISIIGELISDISSSSSSSKSKTLKV
uniref:Uncharacterized protein n=1 Tax=viral metagenome TaxID=1070528 RepID=A0A6C0AXY1_9ZZZZ|tara:strand:- start:171 stop:770 length:600 start_codon:yes stop_codon:yes gene_type:complete